jgi:hypothetical protein
MRGENDLKYSVTSTLYPLLNNTRYKNEQDNPSTCRLDCY